jgi:hypothetical protein
LHQGVEIVQAGGIYPIGLFDEGIQVVAMESVARTKTDYGDYYGN